MSGLTWENLEIGYANKQSLTYPFSGEISVPGIYAILGQNGCGKSTLLKTFIGLISPRKGKITLQNHPLCSTQTSLQEAQEATPGRARGRLYCTESEAAGGVCTRTTQQRTTNSFAASSQGIAYVPQSHTVNKYFHISVFDFIKQGFGPNHKVTQQDCTLISQLLTDWQLAGSLSKSFHELSGGQKVRCMLVRAIISNPKMLFLDEPLASLDVCCQQQLMDTLEDLVTQKGVFVFMVDHHFEKFSQYIRGHINFHKHHDDSLSSVEVVL